MKCDRAVLPHLLRATQCCGKVYLQKLTGSGLQPASEEKTEDGQVLRPTDPPFST
jgi:hypothetical protein